MKNFGDIGFTEEQIDLLTVAESFCRTKSPIERVRKNIKSAHGYDVGVWSEIGAMGWLAIALPEKYGGVGLSLTEVVPVCEQMGRRLLASPFMPTTLAAQAVLTGGTDAQKSKVLPKIASGRAATLALSETNGDWNLHNISAKATHEGAVYKLSGTKTFVMNLDVADWVIVSVTLDGKPALVLIEAAKILEGSIRKEVLIDETKRSYALSLDGFRVEEADIMDVTKATTTLDHIHLCATLLGAAEMTGTTQACIDYTVEYLNTRKQFGKLIGSFQALKHPTVDAFIEYQKARSLLYTAAFTFNKKSEGEIATRMAKAQADAALSFAADRSIQFHGGFGFTYDCDAQLYRRQGIFQASQYGDGAYHKMKLASLLF